MSLVSPPVPRATFDHAPGELRVFIPPRRSGSRALFLIAWLGVWVFAGFNAIIDMLQNTSNPDRSFVAVWIAFWVFGCGFGLLSALWLLMGREVAILRPDSLVLRYEIAGIGRERVYDLLHIRDLRASPAAYEPRTMGSAFRTWGIGGGPIAFDYGSKTIHFGAGIDEAEAKVIVERLQQRNRLLRSGGAP